MTNQFQPQPLVWLKRAILLQLTLNLLFVLYLTYLVIGQPPDGWRNGLNLGFLESIKGFTTHQDVVYFTSEEAGRVALSSIVASLLNILMLWSIKNRRLKVVKGAILASGTYSLLHLTIPVFEIIEFILVFKKEVKLFFQEKSPGLKF